MTQSSHQLVRDFFAALASGNLPDELLTPDMTAWTTTSGKSDKARFQGGVRMLASIFSGSLSYSIDSLTAEDDRVAAEVQSRGKLVTGEDFHNTHVFMFRIRDGRIASVAEHMNAFIVREKLAPLLQAEMAKAAG
jgi:uncharacterized protein